MNDDLKKCKTVLEATGRILDEFQKMGDHSLPINITLSEEEPPKKPLPSRIVVKLSDGASHTLMIEMPIKKKCLAMEVLDYLNERLLLTFVLIFALFLAFLSVFMGCSSSATRTDRTEVLTEVKRDVKIEITPGSVQRRSEVEQKEIPNTTEERGGGESNA